MHVNKKKSPTQTICDKTPPTLTLKLPFTTIKQWNTITISDTPTVPTLNLIDRNLVIVGRARKRSRSCGWQSVIHRWSQLKTLTRFEYIKLIQFASGTLVYADNRNCVRILFRSFFFNKYDTFLVIDIHLYIYHVYRTSCRTNLCKRHGKYCRLSWNLENKNKQRGKKFLDYCVLNYIFIFIIWYM